MDRESEPGDPAEAGGTWFDTPGEPAPDDQPPREPTWFDTPAQRKSLTGQDQPDPVNAGFLARATGRGGLVDPQRAMAVLADVLRDGLLPEPKASEVYWKLAGFDAPPLLALPGPAAVASTTSTKGKERRRGGRRLGSGLAIRDREHLLAEIRRVRDEQRCIPSEPELCRLFERRGGGRDGRGLHIQTLRTALDRLGLTWDQALAEALA